MQVSVWSLAWQRCWWWCHWTVTGCRAGAINCWCQWSVLYLLSFICETFVYCWV